jgi:hypothetical protein
MLMMVTNDPYAATDMVISISTYLSAEKRHIAPCHENEAWIAQRLR